MHCGAVVRWAPRSLRLMGALFSLVQQQLALVVGDLCEHSCICISSIHHGADTQRTCFAGDSAWRRPVGLSCLDPVLVTPTGNGARAGSAMGRCSVSR